MSDAFRQYQERVLGNARTMADTLQQRGLRVVSRRAESHPRTSPTAFSAR